MNVRAIQTKVLPTFLAAASFLCIGVASAHSGAPNGAALLACEAKERSQACQYEGAHSDLYIGTCQYMPDRLLCVRNQPIQKKVVPDGTTPEAGSDEGHEHTHE
ncbi:hypothetical protein EOL70_10170 [Leucothrix sargassi]|nr:hypothetical protein EOL70_10170 [Leucothrix sargassi]